MAYRWNGIECDTLSELEVLKARYKPLTHSESAGEQHGGLGKSNQHEINRVLADNSTYAMWERKWVWCEEHDSAVADCASRH